MTLLGFMIYLACSITFTCSEDESLFKTDQAQDRIVLGYVSLAMLLIMISVNFFFIFQIRAKN